MARGPLTAASASAAAALCQMAGLGDPLQVAYKRFNEGDEIFTCIYLFALEHPADFRRDVGQ